MPTDERVYSSETTPRVPAKLRAFPFGAASAVLAGAVAFVIVLAGIYAGHPRIVVKTDADLAGTRGFYRVEQDGDRMFVWTAPQAELAIPDLDRRVDWRWNARAVGNRPPPLAPPRVQISVDGTVGLDRTMAQNAEPLELIVPRRPGFSGATLTFTSTPAFVPGPQDTRTLGVALEPMSLEPINGRPFPPIAVLTSGVLAMLALGAALAMLNAPLLSVVGGVLVAAAGQAWSLTRGFAAYGGYPLRLLQIAVWISVGMLLTVWGLERIRGKRIDPTARVVVAISAVACYLKLLILLHPGMPVGDGVFHANRFQGVLGGRFYFTSLAPGDYSFPYPILLYLTAAPFWLLAPTTAAKVALLRIIVTAADAAAGAMLYWMLMRAAAGRLPAVTSVVWYHVVPVTVWIMMWGNLSNAFGQALFVTTLAAIVAIPVESTKPRTVALLAGLASAALLSHLSTCEILVLVLALTAVLFWRRGGPGLRSGALGVAIATVAAIAIAVLLYYAWFPTVYLQTIVRIASESADRFTRPGSSFWRRAALVPGLTNQLFGWPTIVAAGIGLWRLYQGAELPRLTLLLLGWASACLVFLIVGLLTPLELRYHLAAFPALALVAAYGWSWAWHGRLPLRLGAALVLSAAIWIGLRQWTALLA